MPKKTQGTAATGDAVQKAAKRAARKPYPTRDERIALAQARIERLSALNSRRAALIEKTEQKLAGRKKALEKSKATLNKAIARKERIAAAVAKRNGMLLGGQADVFRDAKLAQLNELLAKSGKSIDELLDSLKSI